MGTPTSAHIVYLVSLLQKNPGPVHTFGGCVVVVVFVDGQS
jgi:hypothetical protein